MSLSLKKETFSLLKGHNYSPLEKDPTLIALFEKEGLGEIFISFCIFFRHVCFIL
jgi:hypothetical protein